jgi:hypothetical protein
MGFNGRKNTDDIHIRSIIVGLINMLNNQIFYENVIDDTHSDIVEVPFFYSTTGDERFLQDYFLQWNDCIYPKKVDGNSDPIPRGVLKIGDISIDTAGLTQRWIRGEFSRIINGTTETFSAYINSLPLKIEFEVEIKFDTLNECFKTFQAILETFYRVRIFNVEFKGMMIPCQVSFPESMPVEKSFEFSYPSEKEISMKFSLDIESYYPVIDEPNLGSKNARDLKTDGNITTAKLTNADFDAILRRKRGIKYYDGSSQYLLDTYGEPVKDENGNPVKNPNYSDGNIFDNLSSKISTLRHATNKMDGLIIGRENVKGNFNDYKNKGEIKLLTPLANESYKSLNDLEITWEFTGWIDKVNLYYSEDYGNSWVEISRLYDARKSSYNWSIPDFSHPISGVVISDRVPSQQADIRLLVDGTGSIYDYVIVNGGSGYDESASLEIESNGAGAELSLVLTDGVITSIMIYNGGSGYSPTLLTGVTLKIQSSADASIYDILKDENGNTAVITIK